MRTFASRYALAVLPVLLVACQDALVAPQPEFAPAFTHVGPASSIHLEVSDVGKAPDAFDFDGLVYAPYDGADADVRLGGPAVFQSPASFNGYQELLGLNGAVVANLGLVGYATVDCTTAAATTFSSSVVTYLNQYLVPTVGTVFLVKTSAGRVVKLLFTEVDFTRPNGLGFDYEVLGCAPPPETPVSSFNLPIQSPTGLASDGGMFLYLSTGSGARETHKIHRVLQMDVGTIPTGGEPRDVTFDGTDLIFGDLNNAVIQRTTLGTFVNSFALPFRGAGIATDGDTIWVGDFDSNQMLMTANFGASSATFATAARAEGMVFDPSSHTLWVITPFPGDTKLYEMTTGGILIRECDSPHDPGPFGNGGIALVSDTFYIAEAQGGNPSAGTTILMFPKAGLVCTPSLVLDVDIEIAHPMINLKSNGVITVAILSDANFDASTVEVSSVRFGHNGTEAAPRGSNLGDVDKDGDVDMILRFKIQDTGIVCGDAVAYLTGKTLSGQAIKGSDAIQTKGCKQKP